jgi:hypothetical protein
MPRFDFSRFASVAGLGLVAMSVLDVLVHGGGPRFEHAVIVGSGFALFAVSELLSSWR